MRPKIDEALFDTAAAVVLFKSFLLVFFSNLSSLDIITRLSGIIYLGNEPLLLSLRVPFDLWLRRSSWLPLSSFSLFNSVTLPSNVFFPPRVDPSDVMTKRSLNYELKVGRGPS